MANLDTLWFGADIDLTELKKKANQGNKDILDALKLNYDPQSYQQMVSKLKAQLSKEEFKIKVTTDIESARQSVKNTLDNIGKTGNVNLDALKGVSGMTRDIINQKESIKALEIRIRYLKEEWLKLKKLHGEQSMQAQRALNAYKQESVYLQNAKDKLFWMTQGRSRAALAQRELNNQMKQGAQAAKEMNSSSLRLNTTLAGGVHVSTELGSALSTLFAVDAARQFLGNVIEIGGQLEKQRISIGAILGDTVKAAHLFGQIKDLAIKSPFGVVELDQYTKQLSAYGFQYNELFEMTKRLADISAGAGQDIGRLTLALGHVKSATYLTGITLRQFSMNNIPMLKMLAEYYSEVEKHAVSTAEVQKRISKRQVSYEDVIEQIRRLTNEGGMFYNMQEKISESLAAKFKNLKDAMDIMYGEMAEGIVGDLLKDLASVLLKTTKHWQEIAVVMGAAFSAFLFGKTAIGFNTLALQANTTASVKQIVADKQLTAAKLRQASLIRTLTVEERALVLTSNQLRVSDIKLALANGTLTKEEALRLVTLKKINIAQAMHLVGVQNITRAEIQAAAAANWWKASLQGVAVSLKNAFMGIGKGTWTALALMAGTELYMAYNTWKDRVDEKAKDMKDMIKSRIMDLQKLQTSLAAGGMPKDQAELKNRVSEMKQVLANSEAYTKTLDEQLKLAKGLPEQYDILSGAIDNVLEKNRNMLDVQDTVSNMITRSKLGAKGLFDHDFFDFPMLNAAFNDDIITNFEQLNDSYKDLRIAINSLWEYKDAINGVISEMLESNKVSEDFKERLENAPLEEQIRILAESEYWPMVENAIKQTGKEFGNSEEEIDAACSRILSSVGGVSKRWREIAQDDIPKAMGELLEQFGGSEEKMREWAANNVEDVKLMLDGILDQIGEKSPSIRRQFKQLALDYIRFNSFINIGSTIGRIFSPVSSTIQESIKNMELLRKDSEEFAKVLQEDELATIKDTGAGSDTGGGKSNKKDTQLEAAKTRLQEYKTFLSEYKKYIEIYDKEKALNVLEKLFPNLKDEKGNFMGLQLVNNYSEVLDKLRNSLKLNTEARKKWADEVNKTKAETQLDREKETIKENADAMSEYIKRMEEQWKLYRSLLDKSGGNKEFAAMAFNTNGAIWDDTAKEMLKHFNERGNELGVRPLHFDWDFNESQLREALVDADGVVQDELVKLAQEIQKVIHGNYTQFLENSATAYERSLTAAQKLTELERQRDDLVYKRDHDNDQSPEKQKGWNAQIDAKNKEIASQRWAAFKETEDFGRIFTNLDNISTSTLENMRDKLINVLPYIKENVEATKALYEALDKINDAVNERNPFKAMGDSLSKVAANKTLLKELKGKEDFGSYYVQKDVAKKTGVQEGWQNVGKLRQQAKDNVKSGENDFYNSLGKISSKFNALQDVLSPVINLFNQLGMTDLGNLFSMGSNALGSAMQVAGGLNALGLGAAGPYGAALAAGLSVVSSLFSMHDEALQKEIEASKQRQKEMDNASKNLETALDRALGGIYNVENTEQGKKSMEDFNKSAERYREEIRAREKYEAEKAQAQKEYEEAKKSGDYWATQNANAKLTSIELDESMRNIFMGAIRYLQDDTIDAIKKADETGKYFDMQRASIAIQRDELLHQIDAEEDKKDSDSGAIADMKQQIKELEDQWYNFAKDMAQTLYDIDVKDWASQFGDALFEAWKQGESGAEAFKKKASEIIGNIAKNILVQKIIATALEPVEKAIVEMMDETSGELNEKDFASTVGSLLTKSLDTIVPTVEAALDATDEALKSSGLPSMKENADSSLTSSIKGITENTADLLASYLNAIRADVSVNRMEISAIRIGVDALVGRNMLTVTQEQNLQNIADNTKRNADAATEILALLSNATKDSSFGIYMR